MPVERRCGSQHDEVHNEDGEKCTDPDVHLATNDFPLRGTLPFPAHAAALGFLFFNLLRSLPEKQVRANRRTKDRDKSLPCDMSFRQ